MIADSLQTAQVAQQGLVLQCNNGFIESIITSAFTVPELNY